MERAEDAVKVSELEEEIDDIESIIDALPEDPSDDEVVELKTDTEALLREGREKLHKDRKLIKKAEEKTVEAETLIKKSIDKFIEAGDRLSNGAEEDMEEERYEGAAEKLRKAMRKFEIACELAGDLGRKEEASTAQSRIEEAESRKERAEMEAAAKKALEEEKKAESRFENGNYRRAREHFSSARDEYERASEIARKNSLDVVEEYEESISRTRARANDCELAPIKERLEEAERLIERNELEEAESEFEDVINDIRSVNIDRPDEINELRQRVETGRQDCVLEKMRNRIDDAEEIVDQNPKKAESDFREILDDVDELEIDRREEISELRNRVEDSLLTTVEKRITSAEELIEEGKLDKAESNFEDILDSIENLGVDQPDEVEELRRRAETGRQDCVLDKIQNRVDDAEELTERDPREAESDFKRILDDIDNIDIDRPDEIDELRQRAETGKEECLLNRVLNRIDEAERLVGQNPEEAESDFKEILNDIDSLDIDRPDEIAELRCRAGESLLTAIKERIRNAEETMEKEDLDEAESDFERILDSITMVDSADHFDVNRPDEIDELRQRAETGKQDCVLGKIQKRIEDAEKLLDRRSLEEAEPKFEEIIEDIDELEIDRRDEIAELREQAQMGHLETRMEKGRERKNEAVKQFENRDYYSAQEQFEEVKEFFEQVLSLASVYGFDDKKKDIAKLVRVCEENADLSQDALYETTATTPELKSVDDIDLSERETVDMETAVRRDEDRARAGRGSRGGDDGYLTPPGAEVEDTLRRELPDHEVLEWIGSGGNADVHKVRLEETDEIVALKVPRWQGTLSKEVADEFVEEARTWERIDDHENIVSVLDWGTTPYPWMFLEYMDAGSLDENLEEMDLERKLEVMESVCEAAHHAHTHGVVHADLKPENILLSSDGEVKVGDWGLARVLLQHSGSIEGMTPSYSAPEQIDSDEYGSVDNLSDVYQLGVVAYEVFTGHLPFEEGSHAATINAVLGKEPASPRELNPDLPEVVDETIMTALAKRKEDRHRTVVHFRDSLKKSHSSVRDS